MFAALEAKSVVDGQEVRVLIGFGSARATSRHFILNVVDHYKSTDDVFGYVEYGVSKSKLTVSCADRWYYNTRYALASKLMHNLDQHSSVYEDLTVRVFESRADFSKYLVDLEVLDLPGLFDIPEQPKPPTLFIDPTTPVKLGELLNAATLEVQAYRAAAHSSDYAVVTLNDVVVGVGVRSESAPADQTLSHADTRLIFESMMKRYEKLATAIVESKIRAAASQKLTQITDHAVRA